MNQFIRTLVGPDYAVSKNKTDDELGPSTVTTFTVTLSEAKGLSRWAERCFAALSKTELCPSTVTLSEVKGLSHWAGRCFAVLSKTELCPSTVTLSEAKGLSRCGTPSPKGAFGRPSNPLRLPA